MLKREQLYLYSLCVLAFSLCFDPDWSSKALIFVGIIALFNLKIKKELFKSLPFYVLLELFVFTLVNLLLVAKRFDESFLTLIGLLFFFYFLYFQTRFKSEWFKYLLISFSTGVYLVGVIQLTAAIFKISDFNIKPLYNTWQYYAIIDIQKIYYAFYLNLAYLFVIDLIIKRKSRFRIISIITVCLVSLTLFWFTGSLSGIILLLVLNLLLVVHHVLPKYFLMFSHVLVVLPLLIFIALINPDVQNAFSKFETMQMARKPKSWEFKNKYHAHNQYFEFLLGGGLLMLLLFLHLFFVLYRSVIKNYRKALLPIGFCVIITFVFLIESIFRRHHGILFYSFFFILFTHYLKNGNISVTLGKEME